MLTIQIDNEDVCTLNRTDNASYQSVYSSKQHINML